MGTPDRFDLAAYDYPLDPARIAQHPPRRRHDARLMTLDRATGETSLGRVTDLRDAIGPGDCVVRNVARVRPVRLHAHREDTGGRVEVLVVAVRPGPTGGAAPGPGAAPARVRLAALLKPGRRMRRGVRLVVGDRVLTVVGREDRDPADTGPAVFLLDLDEGGSLDALLEEHGRMPLPPYIREDGQDPGRYQTTYARVPGSLAAPTAGFHFEAEDFAAWARRGATVVDVVLHVGLGTFVPMQSEDVREHRMHAEDFELVPDQAAALAAAREEGRRVVAIGTTSVRVLETLARRGGWEGGAAGTSDLYLTPGAEFLMVDALVTNFHLPRSTLLLLVAAFAGREPVLRAYARAQEEGLRFFSFGDAMWIR